MARIEKTVFISYRRKDISWALAVYQYLTTQKYDVFFDYTSIPSGDFEQIIVSNIKARAHFVLILTPTSLDRCSNPGDWLRREIETAMDEKRNIIPLIFDGFNFGSASVAEKLTGKLSNLNHYNGLDIPSGYFMEGMERLRSRYLNVPLNAVLHPVPTQVRKVVKEEKIAADKAVKQSKNVKEIVKPAEDASQKLKDIQVKKTTAPPSPIRRRVPDRVGARGDVKKTDLRSYAIGASVLLGSILMLASINMLIKNSSKDKTATPAIATQLQSTFEIPLSTQPGLAQIMPTVATTKTPTPLPILSSLQSLPKNLAISEWPMEGYDAGNTYWNSKESVLFPPLRTSWEISLPSHYKKLSVSEGVAVLISDGTMLTVDALSGDKLWSYSLKNTAIHNISPVIYDHKVFYTYVQDDGAFALDTVSGKKYWETNGYRTTFSRAPRVYNDVLYLNSFAGQYAINPETGEHYWHQAGYGSGDSQTPFVISEDVFIRGGLWAPLIALNAVSGEYMWSTYMLTYSSLAVSDGVVFAIYSANPAEGRSLDGYDRIAAFNAANGKILWETQFSGVEFVRLIVADEVVYAVGELSKSGSYSLYSLSAKSGVKKSISKIDVRNLLFANSVLYGSGENLYAFRPETLDILWETNVKCEDMAVAYGKLYCLTDDNSLMVFENE